MFSVKTGFIYGKMEIDFINDISSSIEKNEIRKRLNGRFLCHVADFL